MEKEKVLEIEFKEVWDNKWAWRVVKNDIPYSKELKEIEFKGIKVINTHKNSLFFLDSFEDGYEQLEDFELILTDEKLEIEKFIGYVNQKYGIPKRWKPKLEESFFIVERVRTEVSFKWIVTDLVYKNDHWIDFYAINSENCFKTYEEAEKVVLKLEESEKNFWEKVRAGEIEND